MKKTNGNAQAAVEKKPKKQVKPAFKLPSQAEIMKNPMKYLAVAVQQFQSLSQMAAENREAVMQIAKHIESSDKKLAPLVSMLETAQQRQAQMQSQGQPAPQAGGNAAMIMDAIKTVSSSGGGNSEMAGLGRDLVRAQIESIKASAIARQEEGTLLSKIGKEVLTRMITKSVKDTVHEGI